MDYQTLSDFVISNTDEHEKVQMLKEFSSVFLSFVNQIWPGNYDEERTQNALSKTLNITAYDGAKLVGCLRILTDGYYFGTITEQIRMCFEAYQQANDWTVLFD